MGPAAQSTNRILKRSLPLSKTRLTKPGSQLLINKIAWRCAYSAEMEKVILRLLTRPLRPSCGCLLLRSLEVFDQAPRGRRQILEAAYADFQLANSPRICEIEFSHLYNSLQTEKYRFRNDSQGHALLYHSADIFKGR